VGEERGKVSITVGCVALVVTASATAGQTRTYRVNLRRFFTSPGWLLVPALVVLGLAFLYPVWAILARSFSGGGQAYSTFFKTPVYVTILLHTFRLAAIVAGICLILGFPFAYGMTIVGRRMRWGMIFVLMLPLWTSLLVRTYAWLVILNPEGLINDTLKAVGISPLGLDHNTLAVTIGMVHVLLPFMVLPLYAVMRNLDLRLVAAARSLGASPLRAFSSVYIRLALPGIAAGCVMVFILTLGFFITPAILGGATDLYLAQLIDYQVETLLNWPLGAAMAGVLLAATLVLFVVFARVTRVGRIGAF
jgi:putative spermidine/putrescine transport system permease protein